MAPNDDGMLYLPLSSSFDASSPPWQLLNSSSTSPALSWHTLSSFNATQLLLFGGQPGPNSPIVLTGVADSVYLVDTTNELNPLWTTEPTSWANEPVRRIHHSATSTPSGNIYIIGGERADDSGVAFSDHYVFNPSIGSFNILPSDNAPPSITGHASVVLPDGRLLVLGGYSQSSGGLLPLSTIWVLDSSQPSPLWSSANVSSDSLPSPRRAFAATAISGGKVLIQGGSDAALQNNFADGWILDPSQDPMIWTQHNVLSQLGANRDHFAVFSGDQVIFCFGGSYNSCHILEVAEVCPPEGYGNNGPSPSSLQIYNINSDTFETTFTAPSSIQEPSSTSPSSSQTSKLPTTTSSTGSFVGHSSSSAHPSKTAGPKSGDPNGGGGDDDSKPDTRHPTAGIAVGSVLGLLSLIVVALVGTYYIRRRRHRVESGGNFRSLEGGHDFDDGESEHLASSIPVAGTLQRGHTFRSRHGWVFGVFDTLGFVTGTRNTRNAHERKDMLADEDTRDFAPWYDDRREGTVERTWSLRSIIPSLKRSRDPSVTESIGSTPWREKDDPFSHNAALMGGDEMGYMGILASRGRRQQSYTSNKSYHDPFMDPIDDASHDDNDEERALDMVNQPYLHPIPPQSPTLRTMLPMSQGGHSLSPLTEQTSHTTLNDTSNSVSSHTTSHNSPFDTISSLTSRISFDPPKSLLPPSSSTTHMKRSDSWWSRFSRTSFLDRRSSDASRKVLDFRDPNPPPRLGAIEERSRAASLVDRQQSSSSEPVPSDRGLARSVSRLHGGHNKSQSSVRTADTEAIERIARTMDVAYLMRSDSRRTASTTTNLSLDTRPSGIHEDRGAGADPEQTFTSPVEMTDAEALSRQADAYHSSPLLTSPSTIPVIYSTVHSKHAPPPSTGAVAARIQEFERRRSYDSEASPQDQPKQQTKQRMDSQPVNFGLIPRASLFVANPDDRTLS
ncbi:hypothetical protein C0991_011099 [Blastosporella zonata]|nr:hypothetical protein C0991_011099 [Blastosporella zonata]